MADIELVIKIDKDYHEIIKHGVEHGSDYKPWSLIAHGTPLPKGHGRLIDADRLIEKTCSQSCGLGVEECKRKYGYDVYCCSVERTKSAQTIIEADRAESEEKE